MNSKQCISLLDFPNLCRFCLSSDDLKPLKLHQYIINLLKNITSISVELDDKLPNNCCHQCIQKLEDILDFIQRAENNDANLRQTLLEKNESHIQTSFKDFAHICRFCLDDKVLKSLQEYEKLFEIVQNVMSFEVSINDDLSPKICFSCVQKLENLANFIDFSKNNDTILRNASAKVKEEPKLHEYCELDELKSIKHEEESYFCIKQESIKEEELENTTASTENNAESSPGSCKVKPLKCSVCLKCFARKSNLTVHMKIHIGQDKVFFCQMCPENFTQKSHLNKHMRGHTGDKNLESIKQESIKEEKLENPNDSTENSADISPEYVTLEMGKLPGDCKVKPLQCPICLKCFSRKSNLTVHSNIHFAHNKVFQCTTCSKFFVSKQNLTTHMKLHTGERFKCSECSQGFYRKSHLNVHIRIHRGENPYQCQVCSKNFYDAYSLSRHQGKQACGKALQCEICSRKYLRLRDLRGHMRIHSGEKPFKCDVCPRTFFRKCQLNDHSKFHMKDKVFECQFCSKTFPYKGSLRTHIKSHTGEKPYSCTLCSESFSMKESFDAHLRLHNGQDPYLCKVCKKTFTTQKSWKMHKKTHYGEKRFSCHVCLKTFVQADGLEEHLKVHLHGRKNPKDSNVRADEDVKV